MSSDIPYMASIKNVNAILTRMSEAGTPPKFTHEFLTKNLGFKGTQDRAFIKVLKQLGFLGQDGVPTARYNEFRSATGSGKAIADGLRTGWAPIFLSDEKAYDKSTGELTELFKSATGQGEAVAKKMASTFRALAERADWDAKPPPQVASPEERSTPSGEELIEKQLNEPVLKNTESGTLSLHHDVHVHLPQTSDVSVYRAIFKALREELL